jgi:hypothetical protein
VPPLAAIVWLYTALTAPDGSAEGLSVTAGLTVM